jgi:hypothetical protein
LAPAGGTVAGAPTAGDSLITDELAEAGVSFWLDVAVVEDVARASKARILFSCLTNSDLRRRISSISSSTTLGYLKARKKDISIGASYTFNHKIEKKNVQVRQYFGVVKQALAGLHRCLECRQWSSVNRLDSLVAFCSVHCASFEPERESEPF